MMGAAGFEPATSWSEAKYSVQTELSALEVIYPLTAFNHHDSEALPHPPSQAIPCPLPAASSS